MMLKAHFYLYWISLRGIVDQIKKFLKSQKLQAIVYGKYGSNSFQIRTKIHIPIRNKLWYLHFIKYVFQVIAELLDQLYYLCIMIFAKNASI